MTLDSDEFKEFLKIILSQWNLSFNEKVIIELFILPFIMGSFRNSKEKEDLTKEINQYFSLNPIEFFRFFCHDYILNYYEGIINNKFEYKANQGTVLDNAENTENVKSKILKG